jgi:hypothetical protein
MRQVESNTILKLFLNTKQVETNECEVPKSNNTIAEVEFTRNHRTRPQMLLYFLYVHMVHMAFPKILGIPSWWSRILGCGASDS